jgi:hypothetical protein
MGRRRGSKFLAKLLLRFAKISRAGYEKIKNDNNKIFKNSGSSL